jgi:hypothetical protein
MSLKLFTFVDIAYVTAGIDARVTSGIYYDHLTGPKVVEASQDIV